MEYYDAYGVFQGFEAPRWDPTDDAEWTALSVGCGGFGVDQDLPKISPGKMRKQSPTKPMPRVRSVLEMRRVPKCEKNRQRRSRSVMGELPVVEDVEEDDDLTLLRSIDSKKASFEFAQSRRGDPKDEPPVHSPDSVEAAAIKQADGSFMVDLLTNGDNALSLSELFKFKKAFFAADDNGNGVLEWEEFLQAFRLISDDILESDIMTWFAKIDSDCDGFVEWDECFDFLVSMGEQNYFGKPSGEDRLHPCEDVDPVPSRHGHLSMMTRIVVIEEHDKYASVGRDGSLKIFYRESFMPCKSIHVGSVVVYDVCNVEGLNRLAVASSDNHVTFFDATSFGRQKDFLRYDTAPTAIGFSKDFGSYHFAVGEQNGKVHLYSEFRPSALTHGRVSFPHMELNRHGAQVNCLKFVSDIQALVTCSNDGTLKTTHVTTGREMRSFPHNKPIVWFDYLAERKALVCCGGDSTVRLYHPEKLSPICELSGHISPVNYCLADNVSNQLLTIATDKTIKIWDLKTLKEVANYGVNRTFYPEDIVSAACFDSESARVIFGATSPIPWQLSRPFATPKPHTDVVVMTVFSQVFQTIITADLAANVCVWNHLTGELLVQFRCAPEGVQLLTMCLSMDERRLITSSDDGRCAIFNFTCGRMLDIVSEGRNNEVGCLMHMRIRDLDYFVNTSPERALRIWPDKSFSPSAKERNLMTTPYEVQCMAKCPNRNYILVGQADGTVVVWHASLASLLVKFQANDSGAAVEFILPLPAPVDKRSQGGILVSCGDGVLRTWDLGTGAEPPELLSSTRSNHIGIIFTAHSANPASEVLATADAEGYVKLWDLTGMCGEPARPGLVSQTGHWRASRRAVNSVLYIDATRRNPALVVTSSGGLDACIWTETGVRIGQIGEGIPMLWNLSDVSTFDGFQEVAVDLDEDAVKRQHEMKEAVEVVEKKDVTKKNKGEMVNDMVTNIFSERKRNKNKKVERILCGLTVHPPREIAYRFGTGPDQLQQLVDIGKPRFKKR
eukprot:TRINITY_DN10689_c0_g1_i6.p1 TRINITY_DN10689_c0_g1~~TRINITY_DN10689_c0_g1_i6.p1  ORF type:complete len:1010 (-),score=227.54 TRINITY_DN10689_c0_g1_i6:153-3182(-)